MWRAALFFTLGLGLAISSLGAIRASGVGPATACTTQSVQTRAGVVCGFSSLGAEAFLGIPYAESTAGKNRWQPPVPRGAWSGRFAALKYGNACPQNGNQRLPQSEDCLSLNVWTPKAEAKSKRAVLVFIHGGAFVTGSSGDPLPSEPQQALYDGARLASSQGIVVVTMNYRLGALGFLSGVAGLNGNYGLMDQQLALTWVRDNIAAFGGDPARVTLSGESAGAMSVGLHLLSIPSSAGLFRSAIMQSNPVGLPYRDDAEAKRSGEYFSFQIGCFYNLEPQRCLRDQPVKKVLEAQQSGVLMIPMLELGLAAMVQWSPVVDGKLVTRQPLEGQSDKPVLMGVNANEGDLFVGLMATEPISDVVYAAALGKLFQGASLNDITRAYPMLGSDNRSQLARLSTDYLFLCANRLLAKRTKASSFVYQYAYTTEALTLWPSLKACQKKACHSDELPFVFNNLGSSSRLSRSDWQMSQRIVGYWGAFVRDGQPRVSGAPQWKAYHADSEDLLELSQTPHMRPLNRETCTTWDRLGYGGVTL